VIPKYATKTRFRIYRIDENGLLKQPESQFQDFNRKNDAEHAIVSREFHGEVVILPITQLAPAWDDDE
jgi:hypothetical protein